jgi:hypothetical protein
MTIRAAIVTAAAVLVLGGASTAWAADIGADPIAATEAAVTDRVAAAASEYGQQQFDRVVDALAPAVAPEVLSNLSEPVQYAVLGLYARALYGLGEFDAAHEALVGLTDNPNATMVDWMLRLETAERIGDADDAALAEDALEGAADDDDSLGVSIAA